MNTGTMNNFSHRRKWNAPALEQHMYPLLTPLIKSNHDDNLEKDFVKLKFCRDPRLPTLDLYGFKMSLFDNDEPEEFLLFVRNFNTTLAASGTLEAGV